MPSLVFSLGSQPGGLVLLVCAGGGHRLRVAAVWRHHAGAFCRGVGHGFCCDSIQEKEREPRWSRGRLVCGVRLSSCGGGVPFHLAVLFRIVDAAHKNGREKEDENRRGIQGWRAAQLRSSLCEWLRWNGCVPTYLRFRGRSESYWVALLSIGLSRDWSNPQQRGFQPWQKRAMIMRPCPAPEWNREQRGFQPR